MHMHAVFFFFTNMHVINTCSYLTGCRFGGFLSDLPSILGFTIHIFYIFITFDFFWSVSVPVSYIMMTATDATCAKGHEVRSYAECLIAFNIVKAQEGKCDHWMLRTLF